MFSKILIANRGEIAVRIIRACKEMGIEAVAVYSETDKDALHVALADESYCIGPAPAAESYLDEDALITAAEASGAQAIHPGYGFISENAGFAAKCIENGIVFIGAEPKKMEMLSDKTAIKDIMSEAGLDAIPGSGALSDVEDAVKKADEMGYPVMLKAVSGGGGRGINRIASAQEMRDIFPIAAAEAEAAFSDGSLYVEKLIYPANHIEMQILADEAGNAVCLGERDCSVQRRHQKLLEESPSPAVSEELRGELIKRSAEAVKKIGYTGAGTLEFLLDKDGRAWFMEMNIRLQVEHSVTEILTNIDIVKWQIRTAAGISLDFSQEDISMRGASIECRINAINPGTLKTLHLPGGPFVRFDTYLVQGLKVSSHYDPLIGKLIVFAGSREEAIRKMKAALCELVIEGIETNIDEQLEIVSDMRFMSGVYDLTFLEGR